jgi:fatty acid desaturase
MSEQSTNAPATSRDDIARLHDFKHWPALRLWPLVFAMIGLSLTASVLPAAEWPWLLLISPALGVVMFIFVIGFHDASHDRLHPVHRMNEVFGHIVGTLSFVPLNVYRHAHARHHAYLGTQGDPELWPFNVPGTPRAWRVLAAFCEIVFGFIYSPILFLRSVLLGDVTPFERKLIIRGYVGCAVAWTSILAIVYEYNLWFLLLVTAIIPMAISGFLQTVNKFTQHLGLHGKTVLGLTRTVVDEHPAGEVVSSAMFYNDYHGTHHRYAKIPYYNLPTATPYTLANASEFCPVYSNLAMAALAMLPCLANPKVGPQWLDGSDWRTRNKSARESAELIGAVTSADEKYF